ncbi:MULTISPECIES: helix-turn-helix transcriptional regulator [Gordonibacter]|uniref:Helix-turn-helix transcriptional regulator n=1 Tax=Gordonibacter faecis TaxID=3047475 RepID=A0ABT7DNJ4_9ACTN|nr:MULTISPECIES: helix-turn-helix transcriptional regulator [unclassified Gordonibacter]MDJ1651101.1 helix-turn-helix transcriptional regulator [Gordonibacter sp. KGMB12511]HIW75404.1 helix-turn-helix transcriptional regulator [Candidatus Gordonibacter avicola]
MDDSKAVSKRQIGAMELLGMGGFACFFGWMFVSFYWLFAVFIQDTPIAERDGIQLFVFAGITLGYLILHLVSKNARFDPFKLPVLIGSAVLALLLPGTALLLSFGAPVPPAPVLCIINLCAGFSGASLTVSWLDVGSRIRVQNYPRFTSLSLAGGGALFALAAVVPEALQPVFCIIYALLSVGLLRFASARGEGNPDAPPVGACKNTWEFTREIEPSLVAFGIVFGLTFVYLFNSGSEDVLVGLLFVIPGAGVITLLAVLNKSVSITVIQRVLLCITVLACLSMPFATEGIQLACSCLVVASWAAFVSVNYAFIVKKSVERWDTPVFRQAPVRLVFSALGFLVGWAIATAMTMVYGAHSDAFMIVRLCMAFVLVAVVMLFFPSAEHHTPEGGAVEERTPQSAVPSNLSEKELFERRCTAVADLYQLSPRETDILKFLAKGRNAAYIQNKLTISPHTVKSHIYSIYRKLDIHSQQKLMDFIEEFPVEDA